MPRRAVKTFFVRSCDIKGPGSEIVVYFRISPRRLFVIALQYEYLLPLTETATVLYLLRLAPTRQQQTDRRAAGDDAAADPPKE